jgi:Transglycosylase SLT domain
MDYDPYNYSPRPRPKDIFTKYPFATRIGLMVGVFVMLVPVLMLMSGEKSAKVQTTGIDGVALIGPIVTEPVTLPPTIIARETPTYSNTTLPLPASSQAAVTSAAPPASDAVGPQPLGSLDVRGLPDAIPVVKAQPATTQPQIAVTVAKPATSLKPAATTAKPTSPAAQPATTAKPVATTKPQTSYSKAQVMALIKQIWPADSIAKAMDVANLESGYNARAYNGSCCYGVFQLNYASHSRRLAARGLGLDGLYDARVNIEIALEIFREQGWSPWSTA